MLPFKKIFFDNSYWHRCDKYPSDEWINEELNFASEEWSLKMAFRKATIWNAMINLDSILKSRDTTLPTKVCLVKAMVFPVVMYGHERWTIKKAERQRIDAFVFFPPIIFISWRLITLKYCSGFCHTLTWISHGFTCVPHPEAPSHLPPHPIPLGHPSAPAPSTCLMHPTWTGDLFHTW